MVSPVCWWCPLETSFVLLVCACNLCCAQCTHCLSRYTEQGVNAREREQWQFLALNKYFGLQHLLPRNHLSPQHWPHASTIGPLEIMQYPGLTSTGGCFPCLFQVNRQALKKTRWSCQCLEPVTRTFFCPTRSISRPLKLHRVSVRVEFWHAVRKSPVRLWCYIWSLKIPWSSPIFPLKCCAAGDPSLCLPDVFSFKNCWSLRHHIQFQWTVDTSFPVICLSGPP